MLSIVEILKVVFLGIVEGVTEWLPISSTGHMLLVDEFIQIQATTTLNHRENVSFTQTGFDLSFI